MLSSASNVTSTSPDIPLTHRPDAATALWIETPGVVSLRRVGLPALTGDDVRVRSLFTGVSRGTESLVFAGRVPESEFDRMRAPFMQGAVPAPVSYGYMAVGRVEAGPPHLVDRDVFCLHPHQDRFVVPGSAAGLDPTRDIGLHQATPGVGGAKEPRDAFGSAVG